MAKTVAGESCVQRTRGDDLVAAEINPGRA
jgi:hypothetical protein